MVVVVAEVTATELVDVEGEVTEEVTELVSLDDAPIEEAPEVAVEEALFLKLQRRQSYTCYRNSGG